MYGVWTRRDLHIPVIDHESVEEGAWELDHRVSYVLHEEKGTTTQWWVSPMGILNTLNMSTNSLERLADKYGGDVKRISDGLPWKSRNTVNYFPVRLALVTAFRAVQFFDAMPYLLPHDEHLLFEDLLRTAVVTPIDVMAARAERDLLAIKQGARTSVPAAVARLLRDYHKVNHHK